MKAPKKSKLGSAVMLSLLKLAGAVLVAAIFGLAALGPPILGAIMGSPLFPSANSLMIFLAGAAWSTGLCLDAINTMLLAERSRRISKLMGRARRMTMAQLSDALDQPTDKLSADLGRMLSRSLIANASMDLDRMELVVNDVPPPANTPTTDRILLEKRGFSVLPLLWAGATVFTIGGFTPLTEPGGMTIAIIVGAGVLFLSGRTAARTVVFVEAPRPVHAVIPAKTGNTSVDELLNSAMRELAELEAHSRKIADDNVSDKVRELTKTAWEIIEHIKQYPHKSQQTRQFLRYYLPTTVKLLSEYTSFYQHTKTENVLNSMRKIEDMLDTIAQAFRRELDNLYLDKAVDITAEIDVMRGMLETSGLQAADIMKGGE